MGLKNSKELKIGKGGENKPFIITNSISMGSEIITCGSPNPACCSIMFWVFFLLSLKRPGCR